MREPVGNLPDAFPKLQFIATTHLPLNDVLNLILPLLKDRRESVLTAILDWWRSEKARLKGPVPNERLARACSPRGRRRWAPHALRSGAVWCSTSASRGTPDDRPVSEGR
jgi:hypothetical protein